MSNRKRKEIQEYRIKEDTRTVEVYDKGLSEQTEKKIKFYQDIGYKIVALNKKKPKERLKQRIGKEEMKKYLEGNIDPEIYKKLLKKINSREKFCDIRKWLKEELEKNARKNNKKYVPANTIIQVAMENEETTAKQNSLEYIKDNLIQITDDDEVKEN